jgi:hypothetical protein
MSSVFVLCVLFSLSYLAECSLILFSVNATEEFVVGNYTAVPVYFPGKTTPTSFSLFGPLEEFGNSSDLENSIVIPDPITAEDIYALLNFIRKVQTQGALAAIVPSPPSVEVPGVLTFMLPNENFDDITIPTAEILNSDYFSIITLLVDGNITLSSPAKLSDDVNQWFILFEAKSFYVVQFILGAIIAVCLVATVGQAISLYKHRQLNRWSFALLFFEFIGNALRFLTVIDLRGSRHLYGYESDVIFELFAFSFTYDSALISVYFWNDLLLSTIPSGRLNNKIARKCPTRNYVFLLLALIGNFVVCWIVVILEFVLPTLTSQRYSVFATLFSANMTIVVAIILFGRVKNLLALRKKSPTDLAQWIQTIILLMLLIGGALILCTMGLVSGIAYFLSTPQGTLGYYIWVYITISIVSFSLIISVGVRPKGIILKFSYLFIIIISGD